MYGSLLSRLATGEAACIAAAAARGGTVATDDRAARGCCDELGAPCTGTVGTLKACRRTGTVSPAEADGILEAMVAAGYHAPVRRISDLVGSPAAARRGR